MKKISMCLAVLMAAVMMLCSCSGNSSASSTQAAESTTAAASEEETKQAVEKNTNTSDILAVTNRQELADRLGCSLEDLDAFVIYAAHLSEILPDAGETKTDFTRGTTEDGLTWVTKEEARTFVQGILITKENWSDYLIGQMGTHEYTYVGDEGESKTTETIPEIVVKDGYYYNWTDFTIVLKENSTGTTFEYDHDWPGTVEEEDGKIYVGVIDKNSNWQLIEFKPENFTCIKADGVIFTQNVPEDLLIVTDDDWNYLKYSEHKDEYSLDDTMLPVVTDPERPEDTLCYVGYNSIGYYSSER